MTDPRHLKNFIAVIDSGGVRQAAQIVHASPSAVSRSIQVLEGDFGVSLFERRGKRMIPTPQAEILRKEAQRLLSGFEALRPRLAQMEKIESGKLQLGVNPTVANVFLPKVAVRFLAEYPKVEISTMVRDATGLIELMHDGKLEVIVGYDRLLSLQKDFEVTQLYEGSTKWWVRREHPLNRKKRISMGDFTDYPVISQHLPSLYMERFLDLCLSAEKGRVSKPVVHAHQIDDYSVLCRMAVDSDAILLAPEQDIMSERFSSEMVRLHAPIEMPVAPMSAAVPAHSTPAPLVTRFLEILKEEIVALIPEAAAGGVGN